MATNRENLEKSGNFSVNQEKALFYVAKKNTLESSMKRDTGLCHISNVNLFLIFKIVHPIFQWEIRSFCALNHCYKLKKRIQYRPERGRLHWQLKKLRQRKLHFKFVFNAK